MSDARCLRSPPPGFAQAFVKHGWRGIERMFGGHSKDHNAWIAACGGDELRRLRAARQATLRMPGRRCGGFRTERGA